MFVISDNNDTCVGMRLAGIEGVVVHESDEVREQLDRVSKMEDVGIVLMTKKLIALCKDAVYDIKLNRKHPLIVEIPDRHGTSQNTQTISRYVSDAIGVTI